MSIISQTHISSLSALLGLEETTQEALITPEGSAHLRAALVKNQVDYLIESCIPNGADIQAPSIFVQLISIDGHEEVLEPIGNDIIKAECMAMLKAAVRMRQQGWLEESCSHCGEDKPRGGKCPGCEWSFDFGEYLPGGVG